MPQVGAAREIPAPPDEPFELREYPSPDRARSLRFSHPEEFAMGATAWRAELIEGSRTRALAPALSIRPLAPWSPDGRHYAYQTMDRATRTGRLLLAEVGSGGSAQGPAGQPIDAVLWSPTQPILLLSLPRGATLIGADATQLAEVSWPAPEYEFAHVGWLPSGRIWFALSRSGVHAPSEIHFHDLTGTIVDSASLDPLMLVPYDAAACERIRRDTWSLRTGPGTWAVGSLLDRWGQARYDVANGRLLLSVLRPTGAPSRADAFGSEQLGVRAEPRWIVLDLSD